MDRLCTAGRHHNPPMGELLNPHCKWRPPACANLCPGRPMITAGIRPYFALTGKAHTEILCSELDPNAEF